MVLVGVTTDQGKWESHLQGKGDRGRETGEAMTESTMRGREMRTTETVLKVLSERKNALSVAKLRKPDDGKLSRPV